MDDEMIKRCVKASDDYLAYYFEYDRRVAIVKSIIKAMREPTEKMSDAGTEVGPDRNPDEYWYAMIDSITND